MPWLQLIRWKNLLIIFFTQFLVWLCVIAPLAPQVLHFFNFCCIALSTLLIAAAGYIINDYFDNKIDAINKPGKVVLGKAIPRKQAIIYHSVLNGIAILLAGYVAWRAGHWEWLLVQGICTLLLWYYSTTFKRQLITGNVVVALLTALTIITLIIYEPRLDHFFIDPVFVRTSAAGYHLNQSWLLVSYALFAFLLTWMREVVKDMEDIKGDADQGCVTMPIQWGLSAATRFTQLLGIITITCLLLSGISLLHSDAALMGWYLLLIVSPALTAWTALLNRKYTTAHYHTASSQLKIIMVLGLGSIIINILSTWHTISY